MSANFDLLQLYANHMKSIKLRIQKIEEILVEVPELKSLAIPKEIAFEFEFICLQMRKILEGIVQCSMISAGQSYQQKHMDFLQHSRASNIAKNLSKLHSRWFPEFVFVHRDAYGAPTITPGGSAFNKERWADLYRITSEIIHVQNGFSPKEKLTVEFTIPDFFGKISRHLSNHVTTQPDGGMFLCELGDSNAEIAVSDIRFFGTADQYFGPHFVCQR